MPTASPPRILVNGPGFFPEAMITEPPALVTRRAAWSLLRIPPVPRGQVCSPGQAEHLVAEVGDDRHHLARARRAGVARVIEAVDDAEDDEQGGPQQIGDHRGEPVVVAELDLVDADRVVLVDDRDGIVFEQAVRVFRIFR